jgi:glycosyltransferase involved in cell wall biosynthesis
MNETINPSHEQKLVSVIIPCYNQGQYLGEAIKSVLNQTYTPFEIVVVNDGSTDQTSEVAQGFHPGVKQIQQANQGPSIARNRGLAETRGDYIVFLDADDRMLPHALETGVTHLDANPDCAFVSGHIRFIENHGATGSDPQQECIDNDPYLALLQYNYIWTPSVVMFRRKVFDTTSGFSPNHHGAEDWELYLRICRRSPVFCHHKIVAEYRTGNQSLSKQSARMLIDCLAVLRKERVYVAGNQAYEAALKVGMSRAQKYYGEPLIAEIRSLMGKHQWKQAFQKMVVLLKYDPGRLVKYIYG